MYHKPVLLAECIQGLAINPSGVYVDATFGGGGHSRSIIEFLQNGKLIAFDQDEDARKNLIDNERFLFVPQNFRFLNNFLRYYQMMPVDGILADLGVSSHQFDQAERGFSTRFEGPLDMRMDQSGGLSAKDLVQEYDRQNLIRIFKEYGEIKRPHLVADKLIEFRLQQTIETTSQLTDAVSGLAPAHRLNKFLAKVFQAIRIEVNGELEVLKSFLEQTVDAVKPGGRLVVMSYHSLEDRLVKNFMRSGRFKGEAEKDFYGNSLSPFKPIHSKAIVPSEQEISENSRAKSARLRIAQRV